MDKSTKAVLAGAELVIAHMRGQKPKLAEGWRIEPVEWPNDYLRQSLVAFWHVDNEVVRQVREAAHALGAIREELPPHLDFGRGFLYLDKV